MLTSLSPVPISRVPHQAAAATPASTSNPYLQSIYAAAASPYAALPAAAAAATGLIPLAANPAANPAVTAAANPVHQAATSAGTADGSPYTGNPILDAYQQYAALAAAGYTTAAAAPTAASINGMDMTQQAGEEKDGLIMQQRGHSIYCTGWPQNPQIPRFFDTSEDYEY